MKILVMGAGAIGCFVGGHLAGSGQQVTLVGRSFPMQKIAREGLTLRWPGRSPQTVFPATTTTIPFDAGFDFILLTVKAPDTLQVIKELAALTHKTYFVSLQNGIGNEEQLAAAFGPERVIAGTITIPIQAPEPGVIEVSKAKGGLGLATLRPGQSVNNFADALNQAGLTTILYDDYRAMKWSKLLLNIVTNASSAILNLPPAEIIARPELFDLEIKALQEGVAVMRAQGIRAVKLPGYPVDWLARLLSARWLPLAALRALLRPSLASGRGVKMPSLQIDLAAGRSTSEINVLNGAIVEAGQKFGVATPVNQAFTEILSGLVAGRLQWADYHNQPGKLVEAVAARLTKDPN
ncbi:MAG: ketopantoate reductase family protein [Anaerolineales bacterium]|nr:ketopantoate reductase family protein [Anaerolineales bacterium]